ncbi:exonuclease III [Chitinophaga caeni]|uniref:Exonuclease III n=2 Tax=Chitinophaga caeni TaxID=2029983 RepID=A0A291QSR7_9BACT|nr:exonuclease III [Chitinophaga caeni]
MNKMRSTIIYSLLLFCCLPLAAQNTMKVLSYNILEGMVKDTTKGKQQFVEWVKDKDPDILALQECNGFTQKSLEALAASYGHPYAVIVKESGYPVGLTSKYPIAGIQKVNENMTHGFILAKIENLNICVLHLNPHLYQKRRQEIAAILKYISIQPNAHNWLVMGDFNSQTPLEKDRHAKSNIIQRQKDAVKRNPKIHNLVDGEKIDYLVQQQMLNAGFKDLAFIYDADQKQQNGKDTIRSNARIDYIYSDKALSKKMKSCHFIYDDFTAKFSDHRPIILELKN